MTAPRTSSSRRVHFTALSSLVATMVVICFWPHQKWVNRVIVIVLVVLGARRVARTTDAGHLERNRVEDPLLSPLGALGAVVLMRPGRKARMTTTASRSTRARS